MVPERRERVTGTDVNESEDIKLMALLYSRRETLRRRSEVSVSRMKRGVIISTAFTSSVTDVVAEAVTEGISLAADTANPIESEVDAVACFLFSSTAMTRTESVKSKSLCTPGLKLCAPT
eukprot:TRINITY_DN11341_c0_g1::TRINITY_DN11341_c0_g1_i1::g.26451::m.26451 TRINITY_DN11341_c0_g1::TRINITY_DN11341_c0_g1_i1::g.26451  ORF type:complete len:120 (+),score=13.23,Gallidermin/PF02052.10/0.11 TRINITY_DN11341_c0_g1_i1:776-1135(+)